MKLRTLACELLAAICVLSFNEGHKAVLSAMSDFRVAYDEAFRFESLIASLRLPDLGGDESSDDDQAYATDDGAWEARTASMALINAITTCPDALEDRVLLREEFGRRGLNEVIVVCVPIRLCCRYPQLCSQALRYIRPPELLLKQLEVYVEEKMEDEEDMRERARSLMKEGRGHERTRSDSEVALSDLVQLAKQHGELYPRMMDILTHYGQILQRDVGL